MYLRAFYDDSNSPTVSLVYSKGRVAPIKNEKLSLPRLELLGALMCAQSLKFVADSLHMDVKQQFCWTDSTIALYWIRGGPDKWKQFVSNRVKEIREITEVSSWRHCLGKENPADLVSRGAMPNEIMSSKIWWNGPPSLSKDDSDFNDQTEHTPSLSNAELNTADVEKKKPRDAAVMPVTTKNKENPENMVFEIHRFSSFPKAINIAGWVLRFIQNSKLPIEDRVMSQYLSLGECIRAKNILIRHEQRKFWALEYDVLKQSRKISKSSPIAKFNPFLDENGLIRVKTRLHFSTLSYEAKYPILLPKCYLGILLFEFQHHMMKHAEVSVMLTALRDEYWILSARRLAKLAKKRCLSCAVQDVPASERPVAPLPATRVKPALPFAIIGIDHTGVLYCRDFPGHKFSILLITCAVTRAVHLELVNSLGTEDVVLALRRMISRRGISTIVYSDNAKAFKKAPTLLKKHFGHLCPRWEYIAPRAPWWGGWWERLNRNIKSALKRTVGREVLSRADLETVLIEVEGCINSRPLTFLSAE